MTDAPMLLSRDETLLDDVARLAAVADSDPHVVRSAAEARRRWAAAPIVLVGDDVLPEAAAAGLPRRPGVVVVTRAEPTAPVWHAALDLGAEEVVHLPHDDASLVSLLVAGSRREEGRGLVVAVIGGSGGAGASVLAVSAALAGVRLGQVTALVDLDPLGGGLDLALGAEDVPGARWTDLAGVLGPVPPGTLTAALPHAHGVAVLAPARDAAVALPTHPATVPAVLDSLVGECALVVIDLPRADDDPASAALARADVVLLVVAPDVRGSASAQAVCARVRERGDVRAVVRSASGGSPVLDAQAVADWLAVPLAAEIPHDPRLTAALDRGEAPGLSARSRLGRVSQELVHGLLSAR
jgi:secretion/DNA translocation related CpaE-like protein